MRDITRTPVIPLDFPHQSRAVTSELIIDYNKGEIYAVDQVDKFKLINLTSRIKAEVFKYLESLQGNQITNITYTYVDIPDIGRVNISEFLKFLSDHEGVEAVPVGNEPFALRRLKYDNASLITYPDKVAVAGFDEAGTNYVPMKKNGTIEWVPVTNLPTPDGYTPNKYDICDTPIIRNTITLNDNPVQKTTDIDCVASLIMPSALEARYCHIRWITSVQDKIASGIVFPDNIIWRYESDGQYRKDTIYIYEFETFDNGTTWYGKRHSYNNFFSDNVVDQEELHSNYFTKQESLDLLRWNAMDEDAVQYELEHTIKDDECKCHRIDPRMLLGIRYVLNGYETIIDHEGNTINIKGMPEHMIKLDKDLLDTIDDVNEIREELNKSTNDISDEINKNKAATDKVISDNKKDADTKIANLTTTVSNNKTATDTAINNLTTTVANNKTATDTAINNLSTTVANNKTDADTKIANLTTNINSTNNDITVLQSNINNSITNLDNKIEGNKTSITNLQNATADLSDIRNKIKTNKENVEEIQNALDVNKKI